VRPSLRSCFSFDSLSWYITLNAPSNEGLIIQEKRNRPRRLWAEKFGRKTNLGSCGKVDGFRWSCLNNVSIINWKRILYYNGNIPRPPSRAEASPFGIKRNKNLVSSARCLGRKPHRHFNISTAAFVSPKGALFQPFRNKPMPFPPSGQHLMFKFTRHLGRHAGRKYMVGIAWLS